MAPTVWSQQRPVWWLPLSFTATLGEQNVSTFHDFETASYIHVLPQGGNWRVRVDPNIQTFALVCYSRKCLTLPYCVFKLFLCDIGGNP